MCNHIPNVDIFHGSNKVKAGNPNQIRMFTTENVINNNQLMVPFLIRFWKR